MQSLRGMEALSAMEVRDQARLIDELEASKERLETKVAELEAKIDKLQGK